VVQVAHDLDGAQQTRNGSSTVELDGIKQGRRKLADS
jgi:hypothetical protein